MWALCIVADGVVVAEKRITTTTFRIGRDPGGDLVLDDPMVSWAHATLWAEAERLLVRDERSSNGTFVDEDRVTALLELEGDETLRVGNTLLRVRRTGTGVVQRWLLVEVATGVRIPLDTEGFRIGGAPDDDLRVPEAAPHAIELSVRAGEVWCKGEAVPLQVGALLQVAGVGLRVDLADPHRVPTAIDVHRAHNYLVSARRNGPHGPEATVEAPTGARYHVASGNRAILLYLLAKCAVDDAALAPDDRGWLDENEVQRGIWGRDGDQNKLDVLLYRLRRELERVGLDPWFVEKRNRQLRLRAPTIQLRDEATPSPPAGRPGPAR